MNETGFKTHVQEYVMVAATVIVIVLCALMVAPFIPPLVWAFVFAVLFAPLHAKLEKKIKRPGVAASLSTAAIGFVVIGPFALLMGKLIDEGTKAGKALKEYVDTDEWKTMLDRYPEFAPVRPWIEKNVDLKSIFNSVGSWTTEIAAAFVAGSFMQLLAIVLTFYVLFYFLRDRDEALQTLRGYIPLRKNETDRLFRRIGDTVYATVYGSIAVSAIQGALGGLMFWWLGLPGPLLWGVVMGIFAIIPVLGAFIVWIPAAVFLAIDGDWVKALILTAWGAVVIGSMDNVLYPILVGDRLKLHTIPAFLSIVGGLALFGATGLIIGPIVLTVTIELLDIWRKRTAGSSGE